MRSSQPPSFGSFEHPLLASARSIRLVKGAARSREKLEATLVRLAFVWMVILSCGGVALGELWAWGPAIRWALAATALAAAILEYTRRFLDENRRDHGMPLLSELGPGNALTLLRGLALAMMGGFLAAPEPPIALAGAPAALYTAAAIADFFDGYLARRANHSTKLGERLDIELDGLGVLLMTAVAVSHGRLPVWFLPLGLARYLFLAGLWWRTRRGLAVRPIPESAHRRFFAGAQMAFLSIAAWPLLPTDALTVAGLLVAIPTVAGFTRDWLVATGAIDPSHESYVTAQRRVVRYARDLAPLGLRIGVAVSMSALVVGVPVPAGPTSVALRLVAALATTSIVLGWLGRLSAVVLLIPLGTNLIESGLQAMSGVALAGVVSVALLGTGAFSLWSPEDGYLLTRLGSAKRQSVT